MDTTRIFKLAAVAAAVIAISACNDEDDAGTEVIEVPVDTAEITCFDAAEEEALADLDGTIQPTCYISAGEFVSGTVEFNAENIYVLAGSLSIGNDDFDSAAAVDEDDMKDTVLTIEAGTLIYGVGSNPLIIARDGMIEATGTSAAPITFAPIDIATDGADSPDVVGATGLWGGLVINGRGVIQGDEREGEGFSGLYGGDDNEDNSGTLQYVRVLYAGYAFTPTNELNGIAFQGVGSGTTIENIQVLNNSDDGVEFFGGAAQAKYVHLSGNLDDSIDWTQGWVGKLQYAYVETDGDKGIEADNSSSNFTATPRSNPTLANITILVDGAKGANFRVGTGVTLYNSVSDGVLDVDDYDANETTVDFDAVAFNGYDGTDDEDYIATFGFANFDDAFTTADFDTAEYIPTTTYVDAGVITAVDVAGTSADSFFDSAQYLGAVDPTAGEAWFESWIYVEPSLL